MGEVGVSAVAQRAQNLPLFDSIADFDGEATRLQVRVEREVAAAHGDYDVVAADRLQGERWKAADRGIVSDAVLGTDDDAAADRGDVGPVGGVAGEQSRVALVDAPVDR